MLCGGGGETIGPVDFRSLGVREFGTVYEGLLESELSIASCNLAIDSKSNYTPAQKNNTIHVRTGEAYLHNRSGERKSSGSFYTKSFAVEHLLDTTLEPAIDEHFYKLDSLQSDVDIAEAFFDFKVADIAMGSGHFLVAAIDRIESRMTNYLQQRRSKGHSFEIITQELLNLQDSAHTKLGSLRGDYPIEESQLLRRLIAKRCIYGVDLNPLAVQLARLSVWIHTFVPGLPLFLLDHNLVHGNSLVGISSIRELQRKFETIAKAPLVASSQDLLGGASGPLVRLAKLNDATPTDVLAGRAAISDAEHGTRETRALCDLITAHSLTSDQLLQDFQLYNWEHEKKAIVHNPILHKAQLTLKGIHPIHFPISFPEVFLRPNPGFDVLVGNPPWDKVRFERVIFYLKYISGLNGYRSESRKKLIQDYVARNPAVEVEEKKAIASANLQQHYYSKKSNNYHKQGTGHLDLAKLFSERFLHLTNNSSHLGIIIPRTSLVLSGWSAIRTAWVKNSICSVQQLQNKKHWVFEDVHAQVSVVLLSRTPKPVGSSAAWLLHLESTSMNEFKRNQTILPVKVDAVDLPSKLSQGLQIPTLRTEQDYEILSRLNNLKKVSDRNSGKFYSIPYTLLDVGKDLKKLTDTNDSQLRVLRTRDISLFKYNEDKLAIKVSRSKYEEFVRTKLSNSNREEVRKLASDPFQETFQVIHRHPTGALNSRTLISTILPQHCIPCTGYVHPVIMPYASQRDKLVMVCLLNSLLFDWFIRSFCDRHITATLVESLPVSDTVDSYADELYRLGKECISLSSTSTTFQNCYARINQIVFDMYSLSKPSRVTVLNSFSSKGVSATLRRKILE